MSNRESQMHPLGLKKLLKKSAFLSKRIEIEPAGARSPLHSIGFVGTTEVVPCYKALKKAGWIEFFSSL